MSLDSNNQESRPQITKITGKKRSVQAIKDEQKGTRSNKFLKWISASATRMITLSFGLVIEVGTVLLALPAATSNGRSIGLLNALFTATSATCVTGLIVADTALTWSTFGHAVILIVIQIGGLGLITIMSFFMLAARRKMKLKTMLAMQESVGSDSFITAKDLVKRIIFVTASCELIGGLILSWRYAQVMPLRQAFSTGIFQGVSAFCNAGFDLLGRFSGPYTSLTAFNGDPVILMTTALLIIIGGLGFVVWDDLANIFKRKRLHYHSRLVLIMTGILIAGGTIFFLLAEWQNTGTHCLGSLPTWQRLDGLRETMLKRPDLFGSLDLDEAEAEAFVAYCRTINENIAE